MYRLLLFLLLFLLLVPCHPAQDDMPAQGQTFIKVRRDLLNNQKDLLHMMKTLDVDDGTHAVMLLNLNEATYLMADSLFAQLTLYAIASNRVDKIRMRPIIEASRRYYRGMTENNIKKVNFEMTGIESSGLATTAGQLRDKLRSFDEALEKVKLQ